MKHVLIVGAGFAGAVLARELAEAGWPIRVIDARDHIGGNCHTPRDPDTGVMVHAFGPHIFHTSNTSVWDYLQRFGTWSPFVNRVKASTGRGIFSLPINLHTINQFFGKTLSPDEARDFLATLAATDIQEPANFEEQALKFLGCELYEAFFRDYSIKQWGCDPKELPPEVLKRLPVRFTYNDSYYDCRYQAMPVEGYTEVIQNILAHPSVEVRLNTAWDPEMRQEAEHVFFSGALDQFYGLCEGRLGYRTVFWESENHEGDVQGTAVINHTRLDVPWTRVLEHKHFAPWETHTRTRVSREYSKETGEGDIPYYPKRLEADQTILRRYMERAGHERGVSFIGRLGTYRYLDMHQVVAESLAFSKTWLHAKAEGRSLPVFPAALS
ncbi:UDP-galactopyranose/dTDP-fucopyranose mutase family protein [Holophaga foetida]|uniref:UDP-galactopyranose/dTDP-fucopyranose mutase family protein n=1 Tax=Holophaga foetida TaxID=35839 RepID=UPI0002472F3A|nr:UDP-galactopyranose mutase [Holophaga foetida]